MTSPFTRFRDWSLRSKLIFMMTVVSGMGIVVATLIFVTYEQKTIQTELYRELETLAQVIGMNCEASLAFSDKLTAQETLSSLSAVPNIIETRLYTPEGDLFARFGGPAEPVDDKMVVTLPITQGQRILGRVVVESDLSPVRDRLTAQLSTMSLVLLGTLLFVGILSIWIQGMVSRPVQELSRVAAGISRSRSFHLRAKKEGHDELGKLTDAFNTMLSELEQRDAELQEAYQERDQRRREELAKESSLRVKVEEELRQSLEQLQQTQKMESIGRLAGGMAHDFNNMLTAISGYTQMLMREIEADDGRITRVRGIAEATNRAAALTRKLLTFSRKQVLETRVMDLNDTIHNMEDMLCRITGERVVLKTVLADDLPSIEADPGQIEQALMNLIINAVDAMPQGGTISIQTRTVSDSEVRQAYSGNVPPGRYIELTVADDGQGMDKETASQIFEPFFTTKPRGKGTGLGLATVYGIVSQSHGIVTVSSKLTEGTTFSIFLPISEKARAQSDEHMIVDTELRQGKGTVLVAEDEEMIREYVAQVLEGCGYDVVSADDGSAAVDLAESGSASIDVIVSDVMMPNMTGPEAVDRIRLRFPKAGVVFMSGYTQDGEFSETIRRMHAAFLQKPFSAVDLSKAVQEKLKLHNAA